VDITTMLWLRWQLAALCPCRPCAEGISCSLHRAAQLSARTACTAHGVPRARGLEQNMQTALIGL